MNDIEQSWLAGLLEGEGSFMKSPPSKPGSPVLSLQMTDEDVIAKAASLMGALYYRCRPQQTHHKVSFKITLRGSPAADLMKRLRLNMGVRRQKQIDDALATYVEKRPYKISPVQMGEIASKRAQGISAASLAKEYSISRRNIYALKNRGI